MVIGTVVVVVGRGRGARVSAEALVAVTADGTGVGGHGHDGGVVLQVQVVQHLLADQGGGPAGREPLPLRSGRLQLPLQTISNERVNS